MAAAGRDGRRRQYSEGLPDSSVEAITADSLQAVMEAAVLLHSAIFVGVPAPVTTAAQHNKKYE